MTILCACMYVCSVLSDCNPARFFCPRNFPGKNTGMGCHFLLQGIFVFSSSFLSSPYFIRGLLFLSQLKESRRFFFSIIVFHRIMNLAQRLKQPHFLLEWSFDCTFVSLCLHPDITLYCLFLFITGFA